MVLKHSLSILSNNLSLVYKLLLMFLIIVLIASAIFVAVFQPILASVSQEILEDLKDISSIIKDDTINYQGVLDICNRIIDKVLLAINNNTLDLLLALIWCAITAIVLRLLFSLVYMPVSSIIYQKMLFNYKQKFLRAVIATFKESFLFSFLSTLTYSIIDLLSFFIGYLLTRLLYPILGLYGITMGLFAFIALVSVRITMFSRWIPNIIVKKQSVFLALKECFSLKNFLELFPYILTVVIIICGLIATTLIFTLGIVPLVVFPMAVVLMEIIKFVSYFRNGNMNYYIDDIINKDETEIF